MDTDVGPNGQSATGRLHCAAEVEAGKHNSSISTQGLGSGKFDCCIRASILSHIDGSVQIQTVEHDQTSAARFHGDVAIECHCIQGSSLPARYDQGGAAGAGNLSAIDPSAHDAPRASPRI